jgi:hypothetical protein
MALHARAHRELFRGALGQRRHVGRRLLLTN